MSLRPSYRQKQDVLSLQEDHRSRFYERYRKEAEEYDEEFMKKYDEDLNTTLIFVSFVWSFVGRVLMRATGWVVLRHHLRIHHRGPFSPPAEPERRNSRPPPRSSSQDGQHHFRRSRSHTTPMGWSSPDDRPRSSHLFHEPRYLTLFRLPGDAR